MCDGGGADRAAPVPVPVGSSGRLGVSGWTCVRWYATSWCRPGRRRGGEWAGVGGPVAYPDVLGERGRRRRHGGVRNLGPARILAASGVDVTAATPVRGHTGGTGPGIAAAVTAGAVGAGPGRRSGRRGDGGGPSPDRDGRAGCGRHRRSAPWGGRRPSRFVSPGAPVHGVPADAGGENAGGVPTRSAPHVHGSGSLTDRTGRGRCGVVAVLVERDPEVVAVAVRACREGTAGTADRGVPAVL